MPVNDQYILPENVQLIPVNEIQEQARGRFEYNEDDFVITYSNARNTSKIIDSASAVLLREFKKPSSMIEGIFKYSFVHKLDPQETLEKVYPFLARLRSEGFLVLYDPAAKTATGDLLQTGSFFEDYEVIGKLQSISDTEVYKIKKDESFFALKILKTGDKNSLLAAQFFNEIKVLEHLNGSNISPILIDNGVFDNNLYMIMEFFDGVSCDAAIVKYRNINNHENLIKVLAISINILAAYETLHEMNIIHADIHPRNILISSSEQIKIIDFGLTRFANAANNNMRGGIGFFYEPEYANALCYEQQVPASSYAGEQYAVAALIYLLFTGRQYINFLYEKDALLKQIINEAPVPFLKYDIDVPSEIEQVIFKALSKKPEDRYASVAEFKNQLILIKDRLSNTMFQKKQYIPLSLFAIQ